MPQFIALKSFASKHGPVHRGMTITLELRYGRELERNGLVRLRPIEADIHDIATSIVEAPRNAAHAEAPIAKKEPSPSASAGRAIDGEAIPLSASRPARRSRKKTPIT